MAIPTNFQGFTPAANTSKSHKILGSATVGVWGIDVDGTLTVSIVPLAPNMVIFMAQTYTDDQVHAAVQEFLNRGGVSHDGAGGFKAQGSKKAALTSTTCT